MLSEKMTAELNKQIQYELYSGHLYLAMAAYCDSNDLGGFANFEISLLESFCLILYNT